MEFDPTKPWYTSRAVWGGLIAMLSSIALLTGHVIYPDVQNALVDLIMQGVSVVGGLIAVFSRVRTTPADSTADPKTEVSEQ